MTRPSAFTLIELLVVITIIVVLLALLTPALDSALYQAELATCGARLHTVGSGVLSYAMAYKRRYPYRRGVLENPDNWEPQMLRNNLPPQDTNGPVFGDWIDDRPLYEDYFALKVLNCPLAGDVDLGEAANPDSADVKIVAGYAMYFGWKWIGAGGGRGMAKVGDRLGWTGPQAGLLGGRTISGQFALLAGDYDMQWRSENWADGSHPDRETGLLVNDIRQAEASGGVVDDSLFGPFTWARWQGELAGAERGPVDRHFLYDDVSVRRAENNRWDDDIDDRGFMRVPEFADDTVGNGDRSAFLPLN